MPQEACAVDDAIAPEHLHIATGNAAELAGEIRNAGATFLGNYRPVAVGDYVAGPSHVLPTSGTARWAAGLTANDFLRSSSVIHYTRPVCRRWPPDILHAGGQGRPDRAPRECRYADCGDGTERTLATES